MSPARGTTGRHAQRAEHRHAHSTAVRRGQHRAPAERSSGRRGLAILAGLLTAVGLVTVGASRQSGVAEAQTALIAKDVMGRSVTAGFGRADVGGTYKITSAFRTRVQRNTAYFTGLTKGTSVTATLPQVITRDTGTRLTLVAPQARPQGGGLYVYLALRARAANTYYAKVHFQANGSVAVSLSRVVSGKETFLTRERVVLSSMPAQGLLNVDAQAIGRSPTNLAMRVWRPGTSVPGTWQAAASDRTGALQASGAPGIRAYLSATASTAQTVGFRNLKVWNGSVPAAPSATPPAPSTSARPTQSSTVPRSPIPSTSASSGAPKPAPSSSTSASTGRPRGSSGTSTPASPRSPRS